MNTYQVHVVARRCAAVRDHACASFLSPWNAVTAVRLNRAWVSHDHGPDRLLPDRHRESVPSPSRLISYETQRDRLITVEFVAQLYRQPLREPAPPAPDTTHEFCPRKGLSFGKPTRTSRGIAADGSIVSFAGEADCYLPRYLEIRPRLRSA